jgi:hypothetical protein
MVKYTKKGNTLNLTLQRDCCQITGRELVRILYYLVWVLRTEALLKERNAAFFPHFPCDFSHGGMSFSIFTTSKGRMTRR